jgi:ribosomal protein L37AE/L43A
MLTLTQTFAPGTPAPKFRNHLDKSRQTLLPQLAGALSPESRTNQDSKSQQLQQLMLKRQVCPCCSSPLLRHFRQGGIYWRCNDCRQEMPIF